MKGGRGGGEGEGEGEREREGGREGGRERERKREIVHPSYVSWTLFSSHHILGETEHMTMT